VRVAPFTWGGIIGNFFLLKEGYTIFYVRNIVAPFTWGGIIGNREISSEERRFVS
jgi:hypothetical protein